METGTTLKSLHLARLERSRKRIFEGPGTPFKCPPNADGTYTTLTLFSTPGEAIGSIIWSGSGALIEFLSEHSVELIVGKRILEVGCGVGVAGLACAAALRAAQVILTDVASLCDLPQHNVNVNALAHGGSALVHPLDWGEEDVWDCFVKSHPQCAGGGLHTIIGSDVVYTPQGARALARVLSHAIPQGSSTVFIMSYLERGAGAAFFDAIHSAGLLVDRVEKKGDHTIYRIARRKSTPSLADAVAALLSFSPPHSSQAEPLPHLKPLADSWAASLSSNSLRHAHHQLCTQGFTLLSATEEGEALAAAVTAASASFVRLQGAAVLELSSDGARVQGRARVWESTLDGIPQAFAGVLSRILGGGGEEQDQQPPNSSPSPLLRPTLVQPFLALPHCPGQPFHRDRRGQGFSILFNVAGDVGSEDSTTLLLPYTHDAGRFLRQQQGQPPPQQQQQQTFPSVKAPGLPGSTLIFDFGLLHRGVDTVSTTFRLFGYVLLKEETVKGKGNSRVTAELLQTLGFVPIQEAELSTDVEGGGGEEELEFPLEE